MYCCYLKLGVHMRWILKNNSRYTIHPFYHPGCIFIHVVIKLWWRNDFIMVHRSGIYLVFLRKEHRSSLYAIKNVLFILNFRLIKHDVPIFFDFQILITLPLRIAENVHIFFIMNSK